MINVRLIRRMIGLGYTDNDIVIRIRCKPEVVAGIREQMRLEQDKE
jgi:hypothetical protein